MQCDSDTQTARKPPATGERRATAPEGRVARRFPRAAGDSMARRNDPRGLRPEPSKDRCTAEKRKIEVYCAYGFGKPAETVQVGGIPGQPVQLEDISRLSIPELQQRLAVLQAKGEA